MRSDKSINSIPFDKAPRPLRGLDDFLKELNMNRKICCGLATLAGLVVLGLASLTFAFSAPRAEGLDVDMVYGDPFAYKGEIMVRGVVASLEPEKKQFLVIDYREYLACKSVTCPAKWITVSYGGKLPDSGRVVEIKGTVEKDESAQGGFVLKASEVKMK